MFLPTTNLCTVSADWVLTHMVLHRCMALALAPHNVRVNAIGPGSIMTDVLAAVANDKAAMNK